LRTSLSSEIGRSSKYRCFRAQHSSSIQFKNPRKSSGSSTRGSQWSANGSDTRRDPVSQLETRQSTIPFSSGTPGGAVVMTSGSYSYVRARACSHPRSWNADDFGWRATKSSQRVSESGSRTWRLSVFAGLSTVVDSNIVLGLYLNQSPFPAVAQGVLLGWESRGAAGHPPLKERIIPSDAGIQSPVDGLPP
jgi:hypothetical protein